MRRLDFLAVLNIVLSCLSSSGEAQTLTEILSPCTRSTTCFASGPTAATACRSPSGVGSAYLATINSSTLPSSSNPTLGSSGTRSTLLTSFSFGSISPTAIPLLASSTSSSPPASTSGSDDDPSTMTHIPSPVALVAGCLAGSIVIVATLLVFFVARRRKRRRRRMLHEVMNQSWAERLASRHSRVGSIDSEDGEEGCDGGAGTIPSRHARRPSKTPSISQSTIFTPKKPLKSNNCPPSWSKTRYSSRHARRSLETEDLELSSRRTLTLHPLSSSSPITLHPPTIIVTFDGESDASKPGEEAGMTRALVSSSAPHPVSRSTSTSRTWETLPSSQSDGRANTHPRHEGTSSNDSTAPSSTSSSSAAKDHHIVEAMVGVLADELAGANARVFLAEDEGTRRKLGLTHEGGKDGGTRSSARLTDRGIRDEFVLEDMPPAYDDV